ncbi:surface lipoprotein assembly modifier [Tropicibacter naphthalenivorans]|uniref:Surface lipoprotein assembly modifier C-terminal domain-containing protein n=1 Tax=Tropicibacter naphthalenivorans TaxID=441103 RepID=A0A0P1GAQ0_9RHOB|nr:surface lipoprotein assembly modifier [Tropicibacter naphthalenivorans]CUH78580.1 hypothetical protein TRN7648_02048 [Tropicibacter naphthalenivorans]SMC80965.1 Protein of unknown function [Tropicibacter naphthalenivorans]
MAVGFWVRRGVAALAVALCLSGAAQAQEVRLTLPEARGTAARFLANGRPEVALKLAEGVLLGAPQDHFALLIKARALRDLGYPVEAGKAARVAWQISDTDQEKFYAALVVAQAKATQGRKLAAQLWLRRASQAAPDDRLKQTAMRDFRQVRAATPTRLRFDLSLTPSDNLNDAPTSDTLYRGPFSSPLAQPLSGVRLQFGAQVTHRIALGENARVNLGAQYAMTRVRLSSEAQSIDPAAENSDFALDVFGLSLGYEQRGAAGDWLGSLRLTQLRTLSTGEALSDVTQLDGRFGYSLAPGLNGTVSASYSHEAWLGSGTTVDTRTLGLSLEKRLPAGVWRFGLSMRDVMSDNTAIARDVRRADLSYATAKPVMGALPRVTLSYERAEYDTAWTPIWTDPRQDETWTLGLDVTLPKLDYYGFAPEIGVSFRDRRSNYVPYETQGTNLHLGLKSVF